MRASRITSYNVCYTKLLRVGARFAPNGREIVLTLSERGNFDLALISTSGTMLRRLSTSWGIDSDPTWSPDGERLAFVSDRHGNPHLFILDLASNKVERLTRNGKYHATPAWNPKEDLIAFRNNFV